MNSRILSTQKELLNAESKTQNLVAKRMFDLVFSIFAIIVTLPVMAVIAFLIKFKSPEGSILFKQRRLGLKGREFDVYKFRTMIPNAEKKLNELLETDMEVRNEYLTYRKLKNDIRIIKGIGDFLRKTSLDELPQFFNVFKGEMSIVGPRPYMLAEFYQHSAEVVKKITSVKPGITGYWQIIPSRHDTTFTERVKNDLEYLEKRTLWLDMKIISQTIHVMVMRRGM